MEILEFAHHIQTFAKNHGPNDPFLAFINMVIWLFLSTILTFLSIFSSLSHWQIPTIILQLFALTASCITISVGLLAWYKFLKEKKER